MPPSISSPSIAQNVAQVVRALGQNSAGNEKRKHKESLDSRNKDAGPTGDDVSASNADVSLREPTVNGE